MTCIVVALFALLTAVACTDQSSTNNNLKHIQGYMPMEIGDYALYDNFYSLVDSADDRLKRDDSARPGLLRFGKRNSDMPGVLRFGKRSGDSEIPGLLRFGKRSKWIDSIEPLYWRYARAESISKKEMPGVLRFGKRNSDMPGVLRFGKRDSDVPGLLRFGRK